SIWKVPPRLLVPSSNPCLSVAGSLVVSLGLSSFCCFTRCSAPTSEVARRACRSAGRGGGLRSPERQDRKDAMRHLRLGINIDHVATFRNARGGTHPDPLRAAAIAAAAGADGITAHLREDR